jgi:predicted metalloprotease with PDZ domain
LRLAALACLLLSSAAVAAPVPTVAPAINPPQNSLPAGPTSKVPPIPEARDVPYPGTIQLTVDTTDNTRGIFNIHETIPVAKAGDFVLLYPEWLPGAHSPEGSIRKVDGIRFSANGQPLKWVRDTLDVYAFHVEVPAGVTSIDADFQYLSPTADDQGRIVATPDMESIQWIANSLYPAGYYVRDIPVQASLIVPTGWKVATALRPTRQTGNRIDYPVTSYQTLADSPAIAGAHYRRYQLSDRVNLDVIADTEAELTATPEQIAAHQRMVDQEVKVMGAQHYDHYDFLLTISKNLGGEGLEHHRSSEDGTDLGYFTDWDNHMRDRASLIPHEFTHSWNGKYRRAADLWTPDYRTPMQDSMMWVYEGMTQFWGYIIAARSGMVSKNDILQAIGDYAASYSEGTPGRVWRPLEDTTNDPIIAERRPQPWRSWQRSEDYYVEGMLIWIDVDRIIREQSHGKKSIDDFARAFFGMRDGDYGELTYDFDTVVNTLNSVQPYDWRDYLQHRVYDIAPKAPLEGITQGGYNLVFTDQPTNWTKTSEKTRHYVDLTYSGGFTVNTKESTVSSVLWGSPAFDAGLTVGSKVIAVNGREFDADALKDAIKAAKGTDQPITLQVKSGDSDLIRAVQLNWHGGLRYPRLVKSGKGEGTLDALLAPRP